MRARLFTIGLALLSTGCGGTPSSPDATVAAGVWGGEHVQLTVEAATARIEFDCAHGTMSAPIPLRGRSFDVMGTFVLEHGGPVREDEELAAVPARYRGGIEGRDMTLEVIVEDAAGSSLTYSLRFGAAGRLFKCL